jgi:hypothetical protein
VLSSAVTEVFCDVKVVDVEWCIAVEVVEMPLKLHSPSIRSKCIICECI